MVRHDVSSFIHRRCGRVGFGSNLGRILDVIIKNMQNIVIISRSVFSSRNDQMLVIYLFRQLLWAHCWCEKFYTFLTAGRHSSPKTGQHSTLLPAPIITRQLRRPPSANYSSHPHHPFNSVEGDTSFTLRTALTACSCSAHPALTPHYCIQYNVILQKNSITLFSHPLQSTNTYAHCSELRFQCPSLFFNLMLFATWSC